MSDKYRLNKKKIESFLIKNDAMQLVTLTNLDSDIFMDDDMVIDDSTHVFMWPNYNSYQENIEFPKPFIGTQKRIDCYLTFNPLGPRSSFNGDAVYRDIIFTPNLSG